MSKPEFTLDPEERRLVALLLTRLGERSACWRSVIDEVPQSDHAVLELATERLRGRLDRFDRPKQLPLLFRGVG